MPVCHDCSAPALDGEGLPCTELVIFDGVALCGDCCHARIDAQEDREVVAARIARRDQETFQAQVASMREALAELDMYPWSEDVDRYMDYLEYSYTREYADLVYKTAEGTLEGLS